jgi:two-component system CheB/CheR fusion protein
MTDSSLMNTSIAEYIIGIGASAGGLEAIQSFFKKMPVDSGFAFVVLQHLSSEHKSLMAELLAKHTSLPVRYIEEGMIVEKNHIYLLPPRKNLRLSQYRLFLMPQNQNKNHNSSLNLPIDLFFQSLAVEIAQKAVAIIMSGTGNDGSSGIATIKEHGGLVMAQDATTAKFTEMPQRAIETGLVDFILPPEAMAQQLLSYLRCESSLSTSLLAIDESSDLSRIFQILHEKCKVDFTHYKQTTVLRRIERRVMLNQLPNLTEYRYFLENNPSEVTVLFQELLIGVTRFFRDESAFNELRDHWLADVIEHRCDDEIRVWVTACSTGEEAYSFAILLSEYREQLGENFKIKIFATDVDRNAIEKARNGIYPASIISDVPAALLSKYFTRRDNKYQVNQCIRELIVFAQHNLIKDPPFTNIHLLSCRNMLIYLQAILQRKILELFNFSLVTGGILILDASESIGDMEDYFDLVGFKWKIYRAKGKRHDNSSISISAPEYVVNKTTRHSATFTPSSRAARRYHHDDGVLDRFVQGIADDLLPFTLLVNERMEVTHIFGDAKNYLAYATGKLALDVRHLVKKDLSIPIMTGIKRALGGLNDIVLTDIHIREGTLTRFVNLHIKQLPEKKGQESLLAVFISEAVKKEGYKPDALVFDLDQETEQRISDLEHELQYTRETLQATVEELETSNEELQATNEELLASNEELQSANEELQSVNEELYNVNSEYQSKINELTLVNNDLDNLFNSTHIATLFLDENLDIRRFTPKLQSIFNIMEHDIGRPYQHLSHRISGVDLGELIDSVMRYHQSVLKDVQTDTGNWYFLRITPYAVADSVYAGVILTFVDIDQLKKTQIELQQREQEDTQRLATMVHYSRDAISLQTLDGQILTWNRGAEELYGWTQAEALLINFMELIPKAEQRHDAQMRTNLKTGQAVSSFETQRITKDGKIFNVWVTVSVLYAENHQRELIAFTERVRSRQSDRQTDCKSCVQCSSPTLIQ